MVVGSRWLGRGGVEDKVAGVSGWRMLLACILRS